MLRKLLPLSLGACLLASASTSSAQVTFETIITDQPSFSGDIVEAKGLPDGGLVAVGSGLTRIAGQALPVSAVTLTRYDRRGAVVWVRTYPTPKLLPYYHYDLVRSATVYVDRVHLDVVGDTAYVLATEVPRADRTLPVSIRSVSLATGEQGRYTTVAGSGSVDEIGYPHHFAVIEDAAVIVRVAPEPWTDLSTNMLQVVGLDGTLRREIVRPRNYIYAATAWAAAGRVIFGDVRLLTIDARGDTATLEREQIYGVESGSTMVLVNDKTAVYTSPYLSGVASALTFATTDGERVTTVRQAIPQELAEGYIYDLTAWGQDSIAVTIGPPASYGLQVHLFAMTGAYGRVLPGESSYLWHHSTDGPKQGVVTESPVAPPQRRVLARSFWVAGPMVVVDYARGDTVASPVAVGAIDSTLFDDLYEVTLGPAGESVGLQYVSEDSSRWFRFGDDGRALPLPGGADSFALSRGGYNVIVPLDRGQGYVALKPTLYYNNEIQVFDADLKRIGRKQIPGFGSPDYFGHDRHPAGGTVLALSDSSVVTLTHIRTDGSFGPFARVRLDDRIYGSVYSYGMSVGPAGEFAMTGTLAGKPGRTGDFFVERDRNGKPRLNLPITSVPQRAQPLYSPAGDLLLYNSAGTFQYYAQTGDGGLVLAKAGTLTTDDIQISGAHFVDADRVLLSLTTTDVAGVSRASMATYELSSGNLTERYVLAEGSTATGLQVGAGGRVLQSIRLNGGYRSVVISQGLLSSVRTAAQVTAGHLRVRSPFGNALDFTLDTPAGVIANQPAHLLDAAGRTVYGGIPEARGEGQYRLTLPADIAPGIYTLTFAQRAGLAVRQ